jgi:hypothetical protein
MLARRRLEEIEREVGRQDAAHAITLARSRQRDLAVDDHLRPALDGRDDHVDTLRRAIKRGWVGEVALDQFRAAGEQRLELVVAGIADEQLDARFRLIQQVRRDAASQHPGGADQKNGVSHGGDPRRSHEE